MPKKWVEYVADFETTVFEGQERTDVWAAAIIELYTDEPKLFFRIEDFLDYVLSFRENSKIDFHNLAFDSTFIFHALIEHYQFLECSIKIENEKSKLGYDIVGFCKDAQMPINSYKYSISNKGQFYTITIRTKYCYIQFCDSLKLLPFSLKEVADNFETKHKKKEIEYTGFRYPGCPVTEEEKEYIINDVYVIKEALEIMRGRGHDQLTIGSCCLKEFKLKYDNWEYKQRFPDVYDIRIDPELYGQSNAGEYILKSYQGGWCYLVPEKANKVLYNGITVDANSHYPSMMHSDSGNRFPVGKPTFWVGDIPETVTRSATKYYFIRFRCRFELKPGMLPFVHIRGKWYYRANESLTTSRPYIGGRYVNRMKDLTGEEIDGMVELTMTCTDWVRFQEHYYIFDLKIISGCWFNTDTGMFDEYVEKYRQLKIDAKNKVERTLAKLMQNNLYGKFSATPDNSFKTVYIDEEGALAFHTWNSVGKIPGYIPIGSAITSYARDRTIRYAQANYHGGDKPGLVYSDTDSIHLDGMTEAELIGIPIDDKKYCYWKEEASWDRAIFARQKTYIEHVISEEHKPPKNGAYYSIKCAGMGKDSKKLVQGALEGMTSKNLPDKVKNEVWSEFLDRGMKLEDFKVGFSVPGTLKKKRIRGGTLLIEQKYVMR